MTVLERKLKTNLPSGLKLREVREMLGLSHAQSYAWVTRKRYKLVDRRGRKVSPVTRTRVKFLRRNLRRMKMSRIVAELGVSRQYLHSLIAAYGLNTKA